MMKLGNKDWYYSPHKDDKDLLIFTTKDVKVPYAELVEIVAYLFCQSYPFLGI